MFNTIQRSFCFLLVATLLTSVLCAGEETKSAGTSLVPPAPPETAAPRETFTDPVGGFSLTLPTGYRRLTEDETREVFKGLSLNKDGKDLAPKRPPVWFIGPVNPKQPNDRPPSLALAYTENPEQIDPAQIPAYRDAIEEKRKQEGSGIKDVVLTVVQVDGITSLQVESDMINPINNARDRLLRVAVPGKGKWFELLFNYSSDQDAAVRTALKESLDTFKVMEHPPENIENTKKWMRVFYYTAGFGLIGIALSFVLRLFEKKK